MITSFEILDRTGRERVDRIFGYYASETAADQEMECDLCEVVYARLVDRAV